MTKVKENDRKFKRHNVDVKIDFYYDIKTEVKFELRDVNQKEEHKYSAFSRNVSIEGLSFSSEKKLKKGDSINMEVFYAKDEIPVYMQGEVRWSKVDSMKNKDRSVYMTGVKIVKVDGESVADSIYFDKHYQVDWSPVLEAVLGRFRILAQQRANKR